MTVLKKTYTWIVGLIGLIASVLTIIDLIEDKPILSTVKRVSTWIWVNILDYNFPVWQIIIGLTSFYIFLRIIYRTTSKEKYIDKVQEYITDEFAGFTWKWYWEFNEIWQKYEIVELRPECPKCNTSMNIYDHTTDSVAVCPRCDTRYEKIKNTQKISDLIVDNARKPNYINNK